VSAIIPRCCWILTRGDIVSKCGAPATHRCPETCATFCEDHADDYSDCFGDDSLIELPTMKSKQ
jgi:hypothetical protein